jgi:hypothetical protein
VLLQVLADGLLRRGLRHADAPRSRVASSAPSMSQDPVGCYV